MRKKLLEYSYYKKLGHIPSALSMLDYVEVLFTEEIIKVDDYIVIGKPFGSQAYYLIWHKLGLIDSVENLSVGVKHDELSFVDYSEETMGNALGIAIGIALVNPDKRVWVNITDATLQMGNTLEAIQFIGHHQLNNLFVTVDYNNSQVTDITNKILTVNPIIDMCMKYNWRVQTVDGHNKKSLRLSFNCISKQQPNIIFCFTVKGYGVPKMEKDPRKWHYKKIETMEELQSLVAELEVT